MGSKSYRVRQQGLSIVVSEHAINRLIERFEGYQSTQRCVIAAMLTRAWRRGQTYGFFNRGSFMRLWVEPRRNADVVLAGKASGKNKPICIATVLTKDMANQRIIEMMRGNERLKSVAVSGGVSGG